MSLKRASALSFSVLRSGSDFLLVPLIVVPLAPVPVGAEPVSEVCAAALAETISIVCGRCMRDTKSGSKIGMAQVVSPA
jgi:hypothetical protein